MVKEATNEEKINHVCARPVVRLACCYEVAVARN